MNAEPPVIDPRREAEVLRAMLDRAPGYTPEWTSKSGAPDLALAKVFARYTAIFLDGLRQAPGRAFLRFLDMTATRLLPAEPARVPLVFKLLDAATTDPVAPASSQVAAVIPPPPPSPLLGNEAASKAPEIIFATEKELTLARSRLAAMYSIDPGSDQYSDHSARLSLGFTLFDEMRPLEHALYLGHDRLFSLAANAQVPAEVRLAVQFASLKFAMSKLEIDWEYLSKDGWLPLTLSTVDGEGDTTEGFTHDGQIILRKECGPDAREETIAGQTSYWIRGILRTPLITGVGNDVLATPVVDNISARVSFVKSDLVAEGAANDSISLDISTTFFPFGQQPRPYSTFAIASKEVFQRGGARVDLKFRTPTEYLISPAILGPGTPPPPAPDLTWEYFDGKQWRSLEDFEFHDGTDALRQGGTVSFRCPSDWAETSIAGISSLWLRTRIDFGSYGHPQQLKVEGSGSNTTVKLDESTLRPPVIASVTLQYAYQTNSELLDHCIAFNDFAFSDCTEACRWPRRTFEPFRPVEESQPAVHFGFDQPFPSGLLSLFVLVPPELESADEGDAATPFVWEYRAQEGWRELGVLDETQGFRRSGMIQFIGPGEAVPVAGLNGELYWMRARLKLGESTAKYGIGGLWTNAVWSTNRVVVKTDELGISDGNPNQTFYFRPGRAPILADETIEVREWSGRGAGWETAVQGVQAEDLRYERDLVTGEIKAVWVRWHERPHLFATRAGDRHYAIERALGSIRTGAGIPPAGSRIVASFATGGGVQGNVPADTLTQLRSGIPYLEYVRNPIAASGGASVEPLDAVRPRGAQQLRHADRGVSTADIEWLARDASPAVARARCLPVTGPDGQVQRGWVTVMVLPHGTEAQPQLTPELHRRVRDYLTARVPAVVAGKLRVAGPLYLPVGVIADVVPRVAEETARVEARLLLRLNRFLHPLTGGPEGGGWDFGRSLHMSQVAALMEETEGVDYVLRIELSSNGTLLGEMVNVNANAVIAAGDHELKLTLRT